MRLYIIRHASPNYKNDTLTKKGHFEAQMLAERLKNEEINRVYSSPLGRALDTAKYTSDMLGLSVFNMDWLKEIEMNTENSEGVLYPIQNISGKITRGSLPLPDHYSWSDCFPFKESNVLALFNDIKLNSDHFINRLGYKRQEGLYSIDRPNEERIAVFCHHGSGLAWIAHLLEIPLPLMWSSFYIAPCSVTVIYFSNESDGYTAPRCIQLGDVSHLYDKYYYIDYCLIPR